MTETVYTETRPHVLAMAAEIAYLLGISAELALRCAVYRAGWRDLDSAIAAPYCDDGAWRYPALREISYQLSRYRAALGAREAA